MTIGKGLFMSLVVGLLSNLSASGADVLQVEAFACTEGNNSIARARVLIPNPYSFT
jgi:hypothetical protein